jgi:pentatricopeptide repeat protein
MNQAYLPFRSQLCSVSLILLAPPLFLHVKVLAQLRSGLERDLVSALTLGSHQPSPMPASAKSGHNSSTSQGNSGGVDKSSKQDSNQARASYLAHSEKRAAQAAAAAACRQSKAQTIALQKLKADLLVCYNAAIKACGKAGALREALDLYEVPKKRIRCQCILIHD